MTSNLSSYKLFSICNMGAGGLSGMCTWGPRAGGVTYQVDHKCPCYKYYVTLLPTFPLWFFMQLASWVGIAILQ